jgi:hypothetical protein
MTDIIVALDIAAVIVVGLLLLRARMRRSAERAAAAAEADRTRLLLTDAKLRAAEILADAQREERLGSVEREVLQLKEKAEREAEAIVRNAELKADEVLSGVERERGRLERERQEVAREQALVAVKRKSLADFLLTALEEIERASANGSANIRGLEELRDQLRSTDSA